MAMDTLFVIETVILFMAQACHVVIGEFYMGDGLKRYSEAVDACRDNNSRIVLPINGAHNDGIRMLLNSHSLIPAWIDLQILGSGWHDHNTDIMLYNQGCFSSSSLVALHHESYSTITQCYGYCLGKSSTYAAFQQNDNNSVCFCPSHINVNTSMDENKCSATCRGIDMPLCGTNNDSSCRVLAINGTTDIPPWDTIQTRSGKSLQCAAFYGSYVDTTWSHYLLPQHCLEYLPSLCSTTGGIQTINQTSTWFEAYVTCSGLGGHLLVPNSNLSKLPAWTRNQYYWTGVTAFKWMSDSISDNNIVYMNWTGGQPDFSRGNCVLMNPGGRWESSRCDVALQYICESGNFSFKGSTSTYIPTGTTSAALFRDLTTTSSLTRNFSFEGSTFAHIPTDTTSAALFRDITTTNSIASNVSTASNDTDVTATNVSTFPPSTTASIVSTSASLSASSSSDSTSQIIIAVSITLIVIISVIVASALLCRKHQLKKKAFRLALNNPTYSPADDDIIKGTAQADVDSYEFVDINAHSKFGQPNLLSDDVNYVNQGYGGETERTDTPVYANLDQGYLEEGVFTLDTKLYDNNPTYSPADDDIIKGTAQADVDSYEFVDINAHSKFGQPNLLSDDVNYVNQGYGGETERTDTPVYANLDQGHSEEGVLTLDTELYDDCLWTMETKGLQLSTSGSTASFTI